MSAILTATLAALDAARLAGPGVDVDDGGTFAEVRLPAPDAPGIERLVGALPDHSLAAADVWASGVVVIAWAGGDR